MPAPADGCAKIPSMTYRDELEAARHRVAELERELAESREKLAASEAQGERELAATRAKLTEKDRALSEAKERLGEADQAEQALTRLREKRERTPAPAPRTPAASPVALDDGERRLRRSLTRLGELVSSGDVWYVVPFSLGFFGFWGWFITRWPVWIVLPLAGGFFPAISYVILPLYVHGLAGLARRWARELPYQLRGYPELLGKPPRRNERGSGGHAWLELTLTFAGKLPRDLDEVLRAFDPRLSSTGRGAFERQSPVSEQYSKSGTRRANLDTNWEVHRWVRRLHRRVLRHLQAAHRLQSVEVKLR